MGKCGRSGSTKEPSDGVGVRGKEAVERSWRGVALARGVRGMPSWEAEEPRAEEPDSLWGDSEAWARGQAPGLKAS